MIALPVCRRRCNRMDFAKVYTCGLGARIFFGDVSVVVAHTDHESSIEYEFDFLNFCMRQIRHCDFDGFLSFPFRTPRLSSIV